jgi:hypothetical protein
MSPVCVSIIAELEVGVTIELADTAEIRMTLALALAHKAMIKVLHCICVDRMEIGKG